MLATSTLTATAVAVRVGATVSMVAEATLTVDTTSDVTAAVEMSADSSLTAGAVRVQQAAVALVAEADLLAGTASLRLASAALVAQSSMLAEAFVPTAKPIPFFDMACTVSPPQGHFEPYPLTLGAGWQTNDVRLMLVSASASGQGGASRDMPMHPDPPAGFTSPYTLDQGGQTHGVYYRRLGTGDQATEVAWAKPQSWRYFMWATLTARGVDPAVAPLAGKLTTAYNVGNPAALVSPVTVPAAGAMILFLGTFPDPGGGVGGQSWASALGVPQGWTPLVATDKSGANYYPFDSNPSLIVIGKSFPAAGTTGTVAVPVGSGAPAFFGMWCFLRPSPDVSITVGAA